MTTGVVKVLLVEDDEDDYVLVRELLGEVTEEVFHLDWAKSFEAGLAQLQRCQHDICLVDYRMGARNGIELLRAASEEGYPAPMILLTGARDRKLDLEAMQSGAADYLVKGQLQADTLGRSIRYALQRQRAAALAAFEQARLASFGAEIGLALTRHDSLNSILERCTAAMAQYLNAALTQISVFIPEQQRFEPRAMGGALCSRAGNLQGLLKVELDLKELAEGKAVLIKDARKDPRFVDQDWAHREGVSSYAAFPLAMEEKVVGLMSVFSQQTLGEHIIQEMGSVAKGIALCIERKQAEEALGRSEVKYRSVVESIKEVIFQLDEFGHWTFLNPAWTAITGFEVKPTLGTFFLEYFHGEDREPNRHVFLKLLDRELEFSRHEARLLSCKGQVLWTEIYLQPVLGPGDKVAGLSGTLSDVTERKVTELQIQKLAAFPQVNPNPVLEFDADGKLSYSNQAAHEMMRSLNRQDLLAILPPGAPSTVRECLRSGQNRLRQEVSMQGRVLTWSFFPVVASGVVHCYGTDVTDLLELEAQLRHAQKLESVGQLAAGVAHDFNNILTVIQGHSQLLMGSKTADAHTSAALQQINLAAQRAAALTRQLLMFSRKQVSQPKLLDLNAVLHNLVSMLSRLLGEDISLENEYAVELPPIEADLGMIEQVVMNLAVNARDAMPKGGRLLIATGQVHIDSEHVRKRADARPGQFLCLSVTDTGCGMDADTLGRIFEPFFTTKEVGKGTGLGLATVYGIVQQHHGWIEVASEPGSGTTFKLYFPAVAGTVAAVADSSLVTTAVRGGNETVLLVEDEPMLRALVSEVLQQHGYRIVEAASGVEALEAWDAHEGPIPLLLTDMVMPEGMSGMDLAQQLRQRSPALKVIVSSGYSADVVRARYDLDGAFFLPKPYAPLKLVQLIRQLLDAGEPRVSTLALDHG